MITLPDLPRAGRVGRLRQPRSVADLPAELASGNAELDECGMGLLVGAAAFRSSLAGSFTRARIICDPGALRRPLRDHRGLAAQRRRRVGFTAGPARRLRASPRHPRPTGAHSAGAPTGYSMTQPGQHSDGLTTACVMTHAVTRWSAADRSLRSAAGGSSVPASGGADKRMSSLRLVNDRATMEPCRAIP
jgi:hypothetical protein